MGLDQTVRFASDAPTYDQVAALLSTRGLTLQLRMIDGELAFPDEQPPAAWQELRVSAGGGMITLRRAAKQITLVIWGNADPNLLRAWQTLTWAWAAAGAGLVETANGAVSAEVFARTTESFPFGAGDPNGP